VCLSDDIKKVKTARLTQKQIVKDIQAIPSKNLENPIPKTHTNFIFRDKVMMYILCV
jgi:hypothetical protein